MPEPEEVEDEFAEFGRPIPLGETPSTAALPSGGSLATVHAPATADPERWSGVLRASEGEAQLPPVTFVGAPGTPERRAFAQTPDVRFQPSPEDVAAGVPPALAREGESVAQYAPLPFMAQPEARQMHEIAQRKRDIDEDDRRAIHTGMTRTLPQAMMNEPMARAFEATTEAIGIPESHALATGMARGGTFGFLDEIAGALMERSGLSYEEAREQANEFVERTYEREPVYAGVGELGGIGATAVLPVGAAARGATMATKVGRGAGAGAGFASLQAAGEAEPGERLGSAAIGSVPGAAIGAATPPAVAGAARVLGPMASRAAERMRVPTAVKRLRAAGAPRKEISRMVKEGSAPDRAQRIREAGLARWVRSPESLAKKATKVEQEAGERIGEILDEVGGASGGVGSTDINTVADRVRRNVVDPLLETGTPDDAAAARAIQRRMDYIVDRFPEGASPRQLNAIKRSFFSHAFRQGRAERMQSAMRGTGTAFREAEEEAVERAASELGDDVSRDFLKQKRLYSGAAPVAEWATERLASGTGRPRATSKLAMAAALAGGGDVGDIVSSGAIAGLADRAAPAAWATGNEVVEGLLRRAPEALGKYRGVLEGALTRGGARELATRTFVLMQRDPEFRQKIRNAQGENAQQADTDVTTGREEQ